MGSKKPQKSYQFLDRTSNKQKGRDFKSEYSVDFQKLSKF